MEEEDPLGQTRVVVVTGVGSEAERTLAALNLHPLRDTRVTEMASAARDSLRVVRYQLYRVWWERDKERCSQTNYCKNTSFTIHKIDLGNQYAYTSFVF